MESEYSYLLVAVSAAAIGAALLWIGLRSGIRKRSDTNAQTIRFLDAELSTLRDGKAEAERRLAAEERTASRVSVLERDLGERMNQLEVLRDAKAAAEVQLGKASEVNSHLVQAVEELRQQLQDEKSLHTRARDSAAELSSKLAGTTEKLEQEMSKAEEKIGLLTQARQDLANQFQVLAENIMARHGETFANLNKQQVEGILTPLRDKLVEFQQGLQAAHTESARERATLGEQIRTLSEASARMTNEAESLTKALKGEAQTQGAWGELILATILEKSGLRAGDEYVLQESHTGEDGARYRPDVIVNLPGGKRVIIDSKVSLTAFEEYVNATVEDDKKAALVRHAASLRNHIRLLAGKEYQSVVASSLDYVIMFVPIEGALAAALAQAPDLTTEAAGTNVAIATPTTLIMALRTIANVWSVERRNRNAEAIANKAGKLYEKFIGFIADMQNLGGQLDRAKSSFDEAMSKLSVGRGNLIRQVENLKELGAKTSKAIPLAMLEVATDDQFEAESSAAAAE